MKYTNENIDQLEKQISELRTELKTLESKKKRLYLVEYYHNNKPYFQQKAKERSERLKENCL